MKRKYTGLILSGGKSSRMGSDKGLIDYKGKPMIEYAIDALSPHCHELLISANQGGYEQYGVPVINDSYSEMGPMGGLYEGLRSANNQWVVVLSCDLPNVSAQIIGKLISNISDEFEAIVSSREKRVQPLCACYSKKLVAKVEDDLNNQKLKMMKFLEEIKVNYVLFDEKEEQCVNVFDNINSQADLR